MPSANQSVEFRFGLKSAYVNTPIKDLNTLYFCTDTFEIYLGDDSYSKSVGTISQVPINGDAGVGTPGDDGRLYFCTADKQLYMCTTSYEAVPKFTWTPVSNISLATSNSAGLLSPVDKSKLDNIADNATAVSFDPNLTRGTLVGHIVINGERIAMYCDSAASYILPAATSTTLGGVKVGSNITNSDGLISLTKANVVAALGYTPPTKDTTYSSMTGATSSAAGKSGLVPAPGAGKQSTFLKGDGTWDIPLDEKVKMEKTNPSTYTPYYIPFGHIGTNTQSVNDGIRYGTVEGTAESEGYGVIFLGNDIASGTAGNKYGALKLYDTGSTIGTLKTAESLTSVRNWELPDDSGTIALTVDIPNNFGKFIVGSTTISADTKSDSLTILGSNVTLTPDATNDKLTIGITKDNVIAALGYTPTGTDTTYSKATSSTLGLVKIGYTESGKNYPVELNTDGQMFVNVPWTDTNTKVTIAAVAPTTATAYYPTLYTSTSGTVSLKSSDDFNVVTLEGTADALGYTNLRLGNNIGEKTAGNKYGQLTLYSQSTGYSIIKAADTTGTIAHTLPATAGILLNTGTTSFTQTLTSGTKIGSIKINGNSTDIYAPTNTDTHYTTHLKVGASATATANAAATNGNVYLNVMDNTAVRDSHNIVGTGATTVVSDANGKITINSTNTTYSNFVKSGTGAKAGLVPAPSTTEGTTKYLREDGTWQVPPNTNTDTKATQTNTTTSADYRVILSTNANDTTETNTLRKSGNFIANPSTGEFYAKGYRRTAIIADTEANAFDLNTLTLSSGSPQIARYICKLVGHTNYVTNLPVADQPFILDVELIRFAKSTDYVTKQTFVSVGTKNNEYVRYCTSGTWSEWTKRVFTDTDTTPTIQQNATTNSNTNFYPVFVDSNNTSNADEQLYTAPAFRIQRTYGTSDSIGKDQLILGSSTSKGMISFYNGTYSVGFSPANLTNHRTIALPDKAGTLALTSDIVDTKVAISDVAATYDVYYPIMHTSTSSTGTATRAASDFNYATKDGSTTEVGYSLLQLGNETPSGTAKNKYGALRIYSQKAYHGTLKSVAELTADRHWSLPNKDGTIALTSDIPTIPTSLKNPNALTIQGNGTTLTNGVYDGSAAKTVNITPASIGAAAASHGTHVTYATTAPLVAGTASAGDDNTVARGDHVHPAQTTVSGNAGSATKLATARTIDGVDFNGTAAIVHYGTCSTAAGTAAKTVACTGYKLVTGSTIRVKFTVTNTVDNPTLNVNSTGAKAIMYRGSAISKGYLAANRVYEFVYDGTDYELVGDINTDTNTKVKMTETNPTEGITYNVPFVTGAGTLEQCVNNGLRYYTYVETADKVGQAMMVIGNGQDTGSGNKKYGKVRIYGRVDNGYGDIQTVDDFDSKALFWRLPNKTITFAGTMSVTSGTLSSTVTGGSSSVNIALTRNYFRIRCSTGYSISAAVRQSNSSPYLSEILPSNTNITTNDIAIYSAHTQTTSSGTFYFKNASKTLTITLRTCDSIMYTVEQFD